VRQPGLRRPSLRGRTMTSTSHCSSYATAPSLEKDRPKPWRRGTEKSCACRRAPAHACSRRSQIAFSAHASLVATANASNTVQVWDTSQPSWRPLPLTPQTDDPQRKWGFIVFGGDGAWLASGGEALRIRDHDRTFSDIINFNEGRQALQIWNLDANSLRRKLCSLLVEGQQSGGWKAPSCE
jgi:hypothetical protein